jgi:hypothetical protein
MDLRYAGTCKVCGSALTAGTRAFYDGDARTVTCLAIECCEADGLTREEWQGSPVSGSYVMVRAERRIGTPAPAPARVVTTRNYRGEVIGYRNSRGRCIDAPCCGCCS